MEETIELPAHPRAARMARDLVRRCAGDVLPAAALDDAVLLTSEVVANAVLHGVPPITLRLAACPEPAGVRIWVTDCDAGSPRVLAAGPVEASGRGMSVVDSLATRWGIEWLPEGGKRVWFDVCGRHPG